MDRETIDKANKIIKLIKENEKGVYELEKYTGSGKTLYTEIENENAIGLFKKAINFESWEIRLMIHNKKQKISELEKQLEQL